MFEFIITNGRDSVTIAAENLRAAHDAAKQIFPADIETVHVYYSTATVDGIERAALSIARRTAVNAIIRQGTPTQWIIERGTARIAAIVGNGGASTIAAAIADADADTQDFFGVAETAIFAAAADGNDVPEQYRAAYRELNKFVHLQSRITNYECSTEFIIDGGGNVVSVGRAIAAIIRGGEKWTPTGGENIDAKTAACLGSALSTALSDCTEIQKRIAKLLAIGYSRRQISERVGRSPSTVNNHVAVMREKIMCTIRSTEYLHMCGMEIDEIAVENAAKNGSRTTAGKARHVAASKATQAERARRYRERKKTAAKK